MQDRNIISGAMAAFTAPFVDAWEQLLPFVLFALVLTFADLRYGLLAAKKRGENIRKSRAVRRTLNKMVDFICWIAITWCLGHTFTTALKIPILTILVLAIIYLVELSSVIDNYFEYKGITKKISITKLLGKVFKKADIEDVLEDTAPEQKAE